MTEKTLSRLKSDFMKAHEAGDKAQAKIYADEIKRRRALSSATVTAAPTQEPMFMPDETSDMSQEDVEKAKVVYPGVGRELFEGLTFGGSGELVGLKEGIKSYFSGGEFAPAFKSGKEKYEAKRTGFKEEYPGLALASEITGSLPAGLFSAVKTAAAKTLAPKLLAPMVGGATYGFLGTEGDLEKRSLGGGIGGTIGLATGGLSSILPFGKTKEAAALMEKTDIPLTVGQQMGGPVQAAEDLLSKSLLGRVAGIPAAQRKAYSEFSKDFIQEAIAPLGVKIPEGLNVKKTAIWAEDTIKNNFKKAVKASKITNTKPIENVLEKAIKPKSLGDIDLNLDDIKLVKKELQGAVASNIFDDQMTGQMIQKSLKSLNTASNKADLPDNVKQVIKEVKSQLESIMVAQNKDNKKLIAARKAYANMFPMVKAAGKGKKKGGFTPEQAEEALISSKARPESRLYEKARQAEVPLSGDVPSAKPSGMIATPDVATGLALIGNPSYLPFLAASPLLYRTGKFGTNVAKGLLSTPRVISTAAGMPVVSGSTGGLLAGD